MLKIDNYLKKLRTAWSATKISRHFDLGKQKFRRRVASDDALLHLSVLGIISGLLTGLLILLFRAAIELPLQLMLPDGTPEGFEGLSVLVRMVLPAGGAIAITVVLLKLGVQHRKIGVAYVMERMSYHQGYLNLKNGLLQFYCGVVTVVSGQSAGREGPAVHLGAMASSLLGQQMKLPNNSIRMLVGCGTAAAISASFNTPIAGVIFAMEVVMLEYTINGFTPIILAAVMGAVISQTVYGNDPAFIVPDFSLNSLSEVPYIVAGAIVMSFCSVLFVNLLRLTTVKINAPLQWKLLSAGLLTGTAAIIFPQIMGIGYDTVNEAIAGTLPLLLLLALATVKLLVTSVSIGLGMPSGIIGPTLFIGATMGGALGVLAQIIMPNIASEPGFYAILGMGAMMGCALQAPLAAIMAVIELTRNPHIYLPTMLMIITSSLIASHFFKQRSVFLTILQTQGLDYQAEPVTMALRRVSVGAIMDRNIRRADPLLSWTDCQSILNEAPKWIIINGEEEPIAVLPAAELARYLEETETKPEFDSSDHKVDLISIPAKRLDIASLHVQATLEEALQRFAEKGVQALYVERTSAPMIKPIIGVITRADIDGFYQYKAKS